MPKNLDQAVGRNHFSGVKHVHESADREEALVSHVRKVAQWIARDAVVAASITGLTDSSGGTAGATYRTFDSVVGVSDNDITGDTTGVQAAAFNTAADLVMDAYREILEDANEVFAEIDLGDADEGPGAATDNIIAALTVAITANVGNTDAATFATAAAVIVDLLHAQALAVHAVDDAREAVGLARSHPSSAGSGSPAFVQGTAETVVFGDDDPDTITRDVGDFGADGFKDGDVIRVNGTLSNNGTYTIDSVTSATVLTLIASDTVVAESLDATETGAGFSLTVERAAPFAGRLGGADTLDIDGAPSVAGADWTLEFGPGGSAAISDAVNGADATSAALKVEIDAIFVELRDNVAFLADRTDEATQVAQAAVGVAAMSE